MKTENIQASGRPPPLPYSRGAARPLPQKLPLPRRRPALLPCQASALCGPRPHSRRRGRRGQQPGRAQAPGGAAAGRKHLPSALYGRSSGHVNSYGGRGRGAAAAGQLVSCGGCGCPPLRSGDEGREAGTSRPPPLSPRDPLLSGRVRGRAGSP